MIPFTCPGCRTAHTANDAFAGLRAKCIRCGTTLFVPGGPDEDEDRDIDDLAAERVSDAGPRSRTDDSPWADGDDLGGPEHAASEEGDPDYADPETPAPLPASRNKAPLNVAAAVVAMLLVGAVGYFGFVRTPTPPPAKKAAPEPVDDEPAAPPVPEVSVFVGPPEPPPPPPLPTIPIDAERLAEELARDPEATNARYAGRQLEVRGECESFQGTAFRFRTGGPESRVAVALPQYQPKFRDEEGRPLNLSAGPALLGGWFTHFAAPPTLAPLPGRPATVRGTYRGDGALFRAHLLAVSAPADALYLGKTLTVVGKVAAAEDADHGASRVTLAKRSSTGTVEVACMLTKSASAGLRLKLGDTLAVTGTCGGRTNYAVVLDNCAVAAAGGTQLSAHKLAADYEEDLQRYPAIDPAAAPVKVTAEALAAAYGADAPAANARFEHKLLELTGTVLSLDPKARTAQFELPTDAAVQVRLSFEPADFAALPAGERRLTFRAEFRGLTRGQRVVTLTDCRYFDADATDATVQRLTADYFPLRAGRQWDVVRVTYPEPPPVRAPKPRPSDAKPAPEALLVPGKAKPFPAQRLQYRLKPDGLLLVGQLQLGTFAGPSLFDPAAPAVKWVGKPIKPDVAPAKLVEAFRLRASELMLEQGVPKANAAADPDAAVTPPDPKDLGLAWHAILPLNARVGRTREANPAPGVVLTTTVESFYRDEEGREAVRVVGVLTNEQAKGSRTETATVYVRGVGEVSRVVTLRDATRSRVVLEQRTVEEPQ